jgi:hypothetical protein
MLEQRLHALKDLPLVGDVRGSHFMMCTEYVANKQTRELLPDGANIGKRISNHCEARGLIIRPLAHLNIMSPPLVMTEAEVDELVTGLAAGIKAAADDLVREGHRIDVVVLVVAFSAPNRQPLRRKMLRAQFLEPCAGRRKVAQLAFATSGVRPDARRSRS